MSTIRDTNWYEYYKNYGGQTEVDVSGGMITGEDHYRFRAGMFDGIALSEEFLGRYYSSVSTQKVVENTKGGHVF